ncbi:MAG TPA: hypothetical protein PLK78_16590 [Verrucomicrobiota bacterium]|nr:hypothetical protein [Verrucomicrobiota bacterium]
MNDPVLQFGKLLNELTDFIHEHGLYLFMAFAWACIAAIAWLLFRKRKSPPPAPASAQTRAIIGTMLASSDMSSDADGGRTRLIMGKSPNPRD